MHWNLLTEEAQISSILEESKCQPILIFKHSKQCFLSIIVKRKFKKRLRSLKNEIPCYEVDVIKGRALSNIIAEKFQVRHESPQLLLFADGQLASHTSHYDIISNFILENLN